METGIVILLQYVAVTFVVFGRDLGGEGPWKPPNCPITTVAGQMDDEFLEDTAMSKAQSELKSLILAQVEEPEEACVLDNLIET